MGDVERRLADQRPAPGRLRLHQLPVLDREGRRQTVPLREGHEGPGIDHPERLEQVRAPMLLEGPAGRPGEQDPQHREGVVIAPHPTRLAHQRQRTERREPLVGPEGPRRRARLEAGLRHRPLQRTLRGRDPEPGGAGQQVAECDLGGGGDGPVEVGVGAGQHARGGELGEPGSDRGVEREHAPFDQAQRCDGLDRLGHRLDAHDRIERERRRGRRSRRDPAAGDGLRIMAVGDDPAGHGAGIDRGLEQADGGRGRRRHGARVDARLDSDHDHLRGLRAAGTA